jgi:hypothetical protein
MAGRPHERERFFARLSLLLGCALLGMVLGGVGSRLRRTGGGDAAGADAASRSASVVVCCATALIWRSRPRFPMLGRGLCASCG